MLTAQFSYLGSTITVKRATIRDRLMCRRLLQLWVLDGSDIPDGDDLNIFLAFYTQTEFDSSVLGLPSLGSIIDADLLHVAYEKFQDMDAELFDEFMVALGTVNMPLGDQSTQPELPDAKKKTSG